MKLPRTTFSPQKVDSEREEKAPYAKSPGSGSTFANVTGDPTLVTSTMGNEQGLFSDDLRQPSETPFQSLPNPLLSTVSPSEKQLPNNDLDFIGPFGKKQRAMYQGSAWQRRQDTSASNHSSLTNFRDTNDGTYRLRKTPESPTEPPHLQRNLIPDLSTLPVSGALPSASTFRLSAPATLDHSFASLPSPPSFPTLHIPSGLFTLPTSPWELSYPASSQKFTSSLPISAYQSRALLPTMKFTEPLDLSTQRSQLRTEGHGHLQNYFQGHYLKAPYVAVGPKTHKFPTDRPSDIPFVLRPHPSVPPNFTSVSQGYPSTDRQYLMFSVDDSSTKSTRSGKKQPASSNCTPFHPSVARAASPGPGKTLRRTSSPGKESYYTRASRTGKACQITAGEVGAGSKSSGPVVQVLPKLRRRGEDAKCPPGTQRKYQCLDCQKEFTQLRNFRYHRSRHEGTNQFACKCPVCGKSFNDKGYLASHLKIHRNAKEYQCEWCGRGFNQRVAYSMHTRIHTGFKPHKCPTCNKAFSRKMLLRQHLRVHTGEQPFHCLHCGKSFADRSNMRLHQRLHTGDRPYNCDACDKTFSRSHHLKTHMNYHLDIRPYQCSKCDTCFTQSSNMRTHLKKCVGIKPSRNSSKPPSSKLLAERSPTAASSRQFPVSSPKFLPQCCTQSGCHTLSAVSPQVWCLEQQ